MEFVMSEEIDHVVEVAGPCPFGERAHLLGEDFFVAVATRHDCAFGRVSIWMRDGAIDWRQYEDLVGCQVELDSWQVAGRRRNRAAIGDPPLPGRAVAAIPEDLEIDFIRRKLNTRLLVDPRGHFAKCADQEINVEMGFIGQREVEVLGEAVCFEVALLETRSALEYPFVRERRMVEDAGEEPAENVVLFDDVRQQSEVRGGYEQLTAINHALPPPPSSWESRGARP